MKKALLSLTLLSLVTLVKAQDASVSHMSWPNTAVLPETHNWSLGFDVVPVISAAGNLFHSPSNNDSIFSQQQFTLVGLYVKNDNTAYRAKLRIGFSSVNYNNLVTDDVNPTTQLTDTWTQSTVNVTIGGGIQKWIGKGRLRGIYGWEGDITIGSHSQTFTYGNPFTETDQTPTSTNFSLPQAGGGFATNDSASRPLTLKDGFTFGFQLNGYIGVEYFFAPKMSFSAEYGWGLAYTSTGEASLTYETWTGGSGGNETTNNVNIGKNSAFVLDVQNATSIIFHLYF